MSLNYRSIFVVFGKISFTDGKRLIATALSPVSLGVTPVALREITFSPFSGSTFALSRQYLQRGRSIEMAHTSHLQITCLCKQKAGI